MANFAATLFPLPDGIPNPIVTDELAEMTPPAGGVAAIEIFLNTLKAGDGAVDVSGRPLTGYEWLLSQLWGKVIVLPRFKDLGFVVSEVIFDLEVWNNFRGLMRVAEDATVSGTGGVTVTPPAAYPVAIAPQSSRFWQATAPETGDPQIDNVVLFVVEGGQENEVQITGLRIALFSPDPDWTEPVRERLGYLTEVLTAHHGEEQRIRQREEPRPRIRFRVLTMNARDNGALLSLLWAHQGHTYAVPLWPDAQPLVEFLNAGQTVVKIATPYRRFTPGQLVVLWRDMHTVEGSTVESVAADSITLASPVSNSWAADGNTYVVPALAGRLADQVTPRSISNTAIELDADFECEVV